MGRLSGRCAIVTGAAYGIGFAAARRFAEEGASVVLVDLKGHEAAARTLTEAGHEAQAVTTDVTDPASIDALVAQVMERYGRIDILVNNAAISAELKPGPFEEETPEDWRRIMEVNVIGVFNLCKAVSPHMRKAQSGNIINVASGTAFKGLPGMLHYVASKGAIIAMTRTMANEFGPDNVKVNAVSPGFTLTESVEGAGSQLGVFAEKAIATRFLKRNAYAADVANVMFFLASDDSGFVTGQTIAADGGSVMH
jgi:Dehydrogenases with different specificities (related to short-chain alcohol dehydrogenases)